MTPLHYALLLSLMLGFVLAEHALGRARPSSAGDKALDIVGFLVLGALTQPFVFACVYALGHAFAPAYQDALVAQPWYVFLGLLLIFDDLLQYAWHRASHSPLLWPLHRAHHSTQVMSARVIYRNNLFYYLAMPAIWGSGIVVYLGGIKVYAVYIVVKLAVITGAHSEVRWDEPLYRVPALRPLMWVVQRTVSTPATHFAHHAMFDDDGVGHYKGNFGNLLFFWDVLFGTAHITQRYPARVGLRDDELFGPEKWWIEFLYPLFRSKRERSALVPGGLPYEEPPRLPHPEGTA